MFEGGKTFFLPHEARHSAMGVTHRRNACVRNRECTDYQSSAYSLAITIEDRCNRGGFVLCCCCTVWGDTITEILSRGCSYVEKSKHKKSTDQTYKNMCARAREQPYIPRFRSRITTNTGTLKELSPNVSGGSDGLFAKSCKFPAIAGFGHREPNCPCGLS